MDEFKARAMVHTASYTLQVSRASDFAVLLVDVAGLLLQAGNSAEMADSLLIPAALQEAPARRYSIMV